jgi:hypothetical protein
MILTEKERIKGLDRTTSAIKENYRLTEGTILATLNIVSDKIYENLPKDFKNTIKKVREEAEAGKYNKSYVEKAVEGVTDFIKVNKLFIPVEETEITKNMKGFAKKTISFLLDDDKITNRTEQMSLASDITDSVKEIIDLAHYKMTEDVIKLLNNEIGDINTEDIRTQVNKHKDDLVSYIYDVVREGVTPTTSSLDKK